MQKYENLVELDFRFDTAENEPAKNLQNFAKISKFANFANPDPISSAGGAAGEVPAVPHELQVRESGGDPDDVGEVLEGLVSEDVQAGDEPDKRS